LDRSKTSRLVMAWAISCIALASNQFISLTNTRSSIIPRKVLSMFEKATKKQKVLAILSCSRVRLRLLSSNVIARLSCENAHDREWNFAS
jgi:hypothetical protein